MIKTILGLILVSIPFLLIYRFKDKKIGFAYTLAFLIFFHLILAIVTQLFGIFNYTIIFVVNLFVALIVFKKTDYKRFFNSLRKIKIDWVLIFIIIILFIQFFSVHYKYTGKVTSLVESYGEVKDMKYPYPYFSDEWSAVTLIKYSITSGKLPLVNPLLENSYFSNFEFAFHSFISEIMLILDLDPLIHYTLLTIFTGLIICLLVYLILRVNKVGKLAASIACLSVPFIVNGANLPGLWTLIPLIMGMISMLLGFFFISVEKKWMILFMAFLTLAFYPPLFVFYTLSLILYFIFAKYDKKEKRNLISGYFIVCIIIALLMCLRIYLTNDYSFDNTVAQVVSRLSYPTLTRNAIPDFSIWKVIPIPILLFSTFGIFRTIRKEKTWLIIPIFVGLFYWWLYSFTLWRYIIEYERVVFSTSVMIVLLSGFGLHYLIEYIKKNKSVKKYKILKVVQLLIVVIFFISAFSYTQRDNWERLKLHSLTGEVFSPASPANNYLHEDDLRLFNFTEKRFLSLPWKGLVIGVATDNYPLETKPATITNIVIKYNDFIKANCEEKREMIEKYEIDYVYSREIDCKDFKEIGISTENLHLYKMK